MLFFSTDMKRRAVLAGAGLTLVAGIAGCSNPVSGGVFTEFEEVGAEIAVDEPPEVTVDGETVTVRGTILYGSSSCGAVDLRHAKYEASQYRLDLLVVAADDSGLTRGCTDDLVEAGYHVEATVDDSLRRVTATEHHVFGEAYSTTVNSTSD